MLSQNFTLINRLLGMLSSISLSYVGYLGCTIPNFSTINKLLGMLFPNFTPKIGPRWMLSPIYLSYMGYLGCLFPNFFFINRLLGMLSPNFSPINGLRRMLFRNFFFLEMPFFPISLSLMGYFRCFHPISLS